MKILRKLTTSLCLTLSLMGPAQALERESDVSLLSSSLSASKGKSPLPPTQTRLQKIQYRAAWALYGSSVLLQTFLFGMDMKSPFTWHDRLKNLATNLSQEYCSKTPFKTVREDFYSYKRQKCNLLYFHYALRWLSFLIKDAHTLAPSNGSSIRSSFKKLFLNPTVAREAGYLAIDYLIYKLYASAFEGSLCGFADKEAESKRARPAAKEAELKGDLLTAKGARALPDSTLVNPAPFTEQDSTNFYGLVKRSIFQVSLAYALKGLWGGGFYLWENPDKAQQLWHKVTSFRGWKPNYRRLLRLFRTRPPLT